MQRKIYYSAILVGGIVGSLIYYALDSSTSFWTMFLGPLTMLLGFIAIDFFRKKKFEREGIPDTDERIQVLSTRYTAASLAMFQFLLLLALVVFSMFGETDISIKGIVVYICVAIFFSFTLSPMLARRS